MRAPVEAAVVITAGAAPRAPLHAIAAAPVPAHPMTAAANDPVPQPARTVADGTGPTHAAMAKFHAASMSPAPRADTASQ